MSTPDCGEASPPTHTHTQGQDNSITRDVRKGLWKYLEALARRNEC